jgi:hypothetical protein
MPILKYFETFRNIDYLSLRNRIKTLIHKCFQNQLNESYMILLIDLKNILFIT